MEISYIKVLVLFLGPPATVPTALLVQVGGSVIIAECAGQSSSISHECLIFRPLACQVIGPVGG